MAQRILLFLLLFSPTCIFTQTLTNPGQIVITKTWSQEPSGWTYPMSIKIPTETMPAEGYPVAIVLHGNGGNGNGSINQWGNLLTNHILIGPTGYALAGAMPKPSWNIADEVSDAPDVEMIADLVDLLQTFSNVDPNKIRLIGSSNGSGLCNRVFIENDDPGIDIICGIVSQLNEPQYHNGNFYYPSGATGDPLPFDGYDTQKTPITGRRYLSICNTGDGIIPYTGGSSVVGVNFLDAQEAAYIVAQSQGYTGMQLPSTGTLLSGSATDYEYAYLSNQVVHLKGSGGHSANQIQLNYIVDYFNTELGNCSATINHIGTVSTGTYQASGQITSNAKLAANASVTYQANVIVLQDGFEATGNTTFHAQIAPCSAVNEQVAELAKSTSDTEEENGNTPTNFSSLNTSELEVKNDFDIVKVYPNPTNSYVNIEGDFTKPVNYEVRSMVGKRIMAGKLAADNTQINLSQLSANIYFLVIENKAIKVVKIN